MAIEMKHLNHIYGQGTIFEQYALKDVNLTIHDASLSASSVIPDPENQP